VNFQEGQYLRYSLLRCYAVWTGSRVDILVNCNRLTPGGSSTVRIYTQTIRRTTQLTTLVGRLSEIRNQSGQTKINDEINV
jgi:hypothetical protein